MNAVENDEMLLKNQEFILENQKIIKDNQGAIVDNQKALKSNQSAILDNQKTLKGNQGTIVKNQGAIKGNQGTIVKNQDAIKGNANEKWIRLSVHEGSDFIEISVTDSGRGIAEDAQAKIFQPFFTTKDVGEGTGLGLSISREMITKHGGTLELDSASVHTRFVIRLPKLINQTTNAKAQ